MGQHGAQTDDVADEQAHGHDQERDNGRCSELDDRHRMVAEDGDHFLQSGGDEEEVDQVDVKRAAAGVLEDASQTSLAGKERPLLPEEGEQDDEAHEGHRQARDVAIDVEEVKERYLQEEQQDAAGQQPLAVEPSLDGIKMLPQQRSQHKEEVIVPMLEAEEVEYLVGDGDRVLDGGPRERVETQTHNHENPVAPLAAEHGTHRDVEHEVLKQHKREPVALLGAVEDAVIQVDVVDVEIDQIEQQGAEQLHRDFLLEEGDNGLHVPDPAGLVEDEAADQEEHGHAHDHQDVVEGAFGWVKTYPADMHYHHKEHGEPAQRVDILNALGAPRRRCCRHVIIHYS